jgi:phosphate-selective porin OprO and OprP
MWISTDDHANQLHIHGYVQADNRMFSNNVNGQELDTFLFRRLRPLFEGTLFNAPDFRFMPDFGQSNQQIQELYLELKSIPFAKLRVGKFKEPIGLEVLRSDRNLTFAERSMASDLIPLRYIGAQVADSIFSDSITYAIGYFNGSNDGSNGVFTEWAHGNEAAGRLFFRPFATTGVTAIRQFGIGVAGSTGDTRGTHRWVENRGTEHILQVPLYGFNEWAAHPRRASSLLLRRSPRSTDRVCDLSQDVLNQKITHRVRNEAWQVAGSVMLTGEKNGYDAIRPRNSFDPTSGFRHLGAVEIAARFSQVRIDNDAFPLLANPKTAAQRAREQAIGANWYLNRYVKLTTDYEHTTFRMSSTKVTPLHAENVLMSRIQLAF